MKLFLKLYADRNPSITEHMKKAETTRHTILQKAFELIYVNGYKTTSIDDILATTAVTKGAFYYHFRNKEEMGLAIIEEVLKPTLNTALIAPLQKEQDPLNAIYRMMHHLLLENDFMKVEYGCPASNLTQEMASWNLAFRKALDELTLQWEKQLTAMLDKGKKEGGVRADVRSRQAVQFILSGYWGIRNFGKLAGSRNAYRPYLKELRSYLDSLRSSA